ncbi:DUF6179 domain-containing protein [Clostridium sp.]|uniref:DUF6179 domain-containing protein n=1 Tax=Clostridium sp. TaxID=1506 RepID=UPI0037C0976C
MCESIRKYDYFIENTLREDYFFKDILIACYEKKLLDDEILKKIALERLETLKVQLKYYTKDASSSVMIEVAERLMEGIDYTIGVYLKSFDNFELILEELKNTSLFDMLKAGNDLIKKEVVESKKLLKEIQENKLKVDNYSYNDTIDYGIPLFFKEYEEFFVPHEGSGSIDYQLCIDNMNYKGIEYIKKYLETLSLENEFCSKFDINEITELLNGYDEKCELLLINIFELVLINALGLVISEKSLKRLNISSMDRERIKDKLSKLSVEELQGSLLKYADNCCEILGIENKELINYIRNSVVKITSYINGSIELNKLETVFISFNKSKNNELIEYMDGTKLSNSAFRKLSERIRECSSIKDKIKLIKNNINSLDDLVDMLEAECLFNDEFNELFKNLSKMEIILLSKYVSDLSLGNEYNKEWYFEFNKYISSLSEEEQTAINNIKNRVELV